MRDCGRRGSAFDSFAKVLGAIFDLGSCNSGIVCVRNIAERRRELESFINGILQEGRPQRGEIAVLRGRLWFANNRVFGMHTRILFVWRINSDAKHPVAFC